LTHVHLSLPKSGHERHILANKSATQLEIFFMLEADPLTDARLKKVAAWYKSLVARLASRSLAALRELSCRSRGAPH